MQLLISQRALLARLPFPDNRRLIAAVLGEMSIKAIFGKVQLAADKPFRERRIPFQHASPRFTPKELIRFARPEFFRPADRFAIHPPILRQIPDPRLVFERLGGLENAL